MYEDLLTINPQVVLALLFSSGVDSHTGVPACITNQCTVQRQHSATRQHLRETETSKTPSHSA